MSLSERIANLKMNGEESWKRRVVKPTETTTDLSIVKSSLTNSTTTWRDRVTPHDSYKFTVKGKLEHDQLEPETAHQSSVEKEPPPTFLSHPTHFDPSDYETFGSFFESQLSSCEISELTDLHREKLLNERYERPKIAKKKRPKLTVEEKVKRGLSCKLDFDLKLRKVAVETEEKYLMVVKGRRQAHCRVVRVDEGLNLGDCFLFVEGDLVYMYKGPYSNLIEKLKCDQVSKLLRKRILNVEYKGVNWEKFLQTLGNPPITLDGLGDDLDEQFESDCKSNLNVWSWHGSQFVVIEPSLKREFLDNSQDLLLFDFGQELYLYGNSNPIAMEIVENEFLSKKKYLIFKKVKRGLEPVEFKIKFSGGCHGDYKKKTEEVEEIVRFDFGDAVDVFDEILLEGVAFSVGRGGMRVVVMEEDPRRVSMETVVLKKWVVTKEDVVEAELLEFRARDVYVVYWQYCILYSTGRLDKSKSHNTTTTRGRDRHCWFFWFGSKSTITDRTKVSALFCVQDYKSVFNMTTTDLSGGSQIAMEQEQEPSYFHHLFNNAIYHNDTDNLYELCGTTDALYLTQLDDTDSLFSDSTYLDLKNAVAHTGTDSDLEIEQFLKNYKKIEITKTRNKIANCYRINHTKFKIENLVDFKLTKLEKNQCYLLIGTLYNLLVIDGLDNFLIRRSILHSVNVGNCFVTFDVFNLNKELDLVSVVDFVKKVESGKRLIKQTDLTQYTLWFDPGQLYKHIDPSLTETLTSVEVWMTLPRWRRCELTKSLFK